ncbi:MAG: hypothetical protein R3D67_20910 [Hyphomicrobiaceae bacterium]
MSPAQSAFAVSSTSHVDGQSASTAPQHVDARFLVVGDTDPGLLPRLVEPFSKLGTVPSRVHASCEEGDGSRMTVDLRLAHVAPRTAELVELSLRRVVGVQQLIAVTEAAR